mmetsp:Transcript_50734/g.164056  ORF Transcript_50734/g.164056 Transcript_50734/m.164056 type:complete len:255 (-) Transcript_50734:1546-2310(-)
MRGSKESSSLPASSLRPQRFMKAIFAFFVKNSPSPISLGSLRLLAADKPTAERPPDALADDRRASPAIVHSSGAASKASASASAAASRASRSRVLLPTISKPRSLSSSFNSTVFGFAGSAARTRASQGESGATMVARTFGGFAVAASSRQRRNASSEVPSGRGVSSARAASSAAGMGSKISFCPPVSSRKTTRCWCKPRQPHQGVSSMTVGMEAYLESPTAVWPASAELGRICCGLPAGTLTLSTEYALPACVA